MPARNDSLTDRLARYREIKITVVGRKSGRAISIPVWFVFDDGKVYVLPGYGSDTQWYKNLLENPSIGINARGAEAEFDVVLITAPKQVLAVIEKFRAKYGGDGVKLYSKLDVVVRAQAR